MKVKYEFVTGEKVCFDLDKKFENVIQELDDELENNDRKETENHENLSLFDNDIEVVDVTSDVLDIVLENFYKKNIYQVISQLNTDEKGLIYALYLNTKPMSWEKCANYLGVKVEEVEKKLSLIRKKLKISMENKWHEGK